MAKKRKHYVREVGESPKGRGNVALRFQTSTPCRDINKTKLIGRNCLIFRYARSFDFAQDDKEKLIFYAPVTKTNSKRTYTQKCATSIFFVNRTKLIFNTII